MSTIVTICARGGSKGVPRKNIRPIGGKPLIVHSIEQAQACDFVDGIYVSTDDAEIAQVARDAGASVPFLRPAELASDSAGKLAAIEHLVDWLENDGVEIGKIVDLDPTSPLRSLDDIATCYAMLGGEVDAVITGYEADKNPYFNMVELDADGHAGLVKQAPGGGVLARQAAPAVYSMNASIYVWHRDTLAKGLWSGRTRLHVMPEDRSVDIDTMFDLKVVEMLMAERNRGAGA